MEFPVVWHGSAGFNGMATWCASSSAVSSALRFHPKRSRFSLMYTGLVVLTQIGMPASVSHFRATWIGALPCFLAMDVVKLPFRMSFDGPDAANHSFPVTL